MDTFVRNAVRILSGERYQRLLRNTGPGQMGCTTCGQITDAGEWVELRCPHCGTDGRHGGHFDGDGLSKLLEKSA